MMVKILFLGANGIDTSRLRIGAELRDIVAEVERAQASQEIEIRAELAVTPVDLNRLLLSYAPDVVHFSGHGMFRRIETPLPSRVSREFDPLHTDVETVIATQCALLFETIEGHSAPVSAEALGQLFGILKKQRCVILNACFSMVQAEAIAKHVDCVIGMKGAIEDRSALVFAVGFYQAIVRGQTVKTAFDLGCSLISTSGLSDADIPQLLGRSDPDRVCLFEPSKLRSNHDSMPPERASENFPLLIIDGGPHNGQTLPLEVGQTYLVGRDPRAHLQLPNDDPKASRRQALIDVTPGAIVIKDLQSKNGIFVNGRRVTTAVLLPGDELRIGHTCIHVSIPGVAVPDVPDELPGTRTDSAAASSD